MIEIHKLRYTLQSGDTMPLWWFLIIAGVLALVFFWDEIKKLFVKKGDWKITFNKFEKPKLDDNTVKRVKILYNMQDYKGVVRLVEQNRSMLKDNEIRRIYYDSLEKINEKWLEEYDEKMDTLARGWRS